MLPNAISGQQRADAARSGTHDSLLDVPILPRADAFLASSGRLVSVNATTLYVQEFGTGPAVVFLNGGPGSTLHSFHPEIPRMGAFAHVILYDRRGQGQSAWQPGAGYSVAQALDDLEALRRGLGIERWTLAGHSWGGFLALAYARRFPEATAGLVLIDALTAMEGPDASDNEFAYEFFTPSERRRVAAIYTSGGRVVADHRDGLDLARLQRRVYNAYMNGDWKRQYRYRPSIQRMAQIALYEWVHDLNYNQEMARDTRRYDLSGAFLDSRIPIMAIEGWWSPVWGTWRSQRLSAMRAAFPRARIEVFRDSAHFPFREEPQRFFETLRAFLQDVAKRP